MIEKVSPEHPDKIADRIAGAIVDIAYAQELNPLIAVEVLIGHGKCHVIIETGTELPEDRIRADILRFAGIAEPDIVIVPQDAFLARNQKGRFRCGDNGIFLGVPLTGEDLKLSEIAHEFYDKYRTDGKYILDGDRLIICQSCVSSASLRRLYPDATVNPLGDWSGGPDVDTGATNRKLGSDMAGSVTGGGLHGKDLSKADVTLNIYAFLKAQETGETVELSCAIGDETIDGHPYSELMDIARNHIASLGGFEKFAEWGLF